MKTIFHALVLNLHQPAGNLEALLENREWEAREIESWARLQRLGARDLPGMTGQLTEPGKIKNGKDSK